MEAVETKVCKVCGRALPVTSFYRCSARPDGYQGSCKECRKKRDRELAALKHKDTSFYGTPGSPLAAFKNRELIEELKARGHRGELKYTHVITL